MNIDIQNKKIGKNYEKIGKKFKINVLVPFPLICHYSYENKEKPKLFLPQQIGLDNDSN